LKTKRIPTLFRNLSVHVQAAFILLVISSFVFLPDHTSAQERASLSGYVTDSQTGETVLGANVYLRGTTIGVVTNTSGYYIISGIRPGTYTVVWSFIGYREMTRDITFEPGDRQRLDIELTPTDLALEELVVQADAFADERQAIGSAQVSTQLVRQVPSVLQADVFRSLQLLPGIKAASDFSSGLYIRGGSPDQTLILLDRTTVYNPTHFFGFFSTFNPDAIKDIRLYKGTYPAEYGGRLGSVVDIYNKDGNRNRMAGTLSLGLLSSRASIEGPYAKGSYMLAFRRSTLEPVLAVLRNQVDNVPDGFYFYDINGKLNFDANENNRFSVAFYSGVDDVKFPFGEDLRFNLNYGNRTLSSTWTHILTPQIFTNLTVTGSQYFSTPRFEFGGTVFGRNNFVDDYSVKGDLEWMPDDRHSVRAGIWAGNLTLRLRDRFDGLETLNSRIQTQYAAFYIQDRWRPHTRWSINAGLRGNYFTRGNYLRFDPRLSVDFQANSRLKLQAAWGRYHQFLTLITNEAFSGFDVWLTTADGVRPAWGDQYGLGLKYIPQSQYNLEFELYYRNMRDLFELDPRVPDAAGLDYADLFRFGEGYAYGLEVLLEKTTGRLNGFIGYTYGNTRRRFENYNNSNFYPPKFDRTHDVNLVANYNLSRRWMITGVFSYATGQAYTEPLGRTQIRDPFGTLPTDPFVVGRVNASRLPAYHRLDLSATYFSTFFGLGNSELQIQVINAYSRRNIWFYNFDLEENPPQRTEVPLLPVIPSLSYTVFF
jgi:hypothetical protein